MPLVIVERLLQAALLQKFRHARTNLNLNNLAVHIIRDKTCIVIVDFDNFFTWSEIEDNYAKFNSIISEIINACLLNSILFEHLWIRFYGGWYTNGILNNRGSIVLAMTESLNIFPFFYKNNIKITGQIELAKAFIKYEDKIFYNTLKEKQGIPRVTVKKQYINEYCHHSIDTCPVKAIARFSEKSIRKCSVETCTHTSDVLFVSLGQKMVDTWMACEIIEIAREENILQLSIFSNDNDLIPPIFLAGKLKSNHQNITLFTTNKLKLSACQSELANSGVDVILLTNE